MKDMRRPAVCGAAVQEKNTCRTYRIRPALMLDILSGYFPSPAADKVSVSAVLALGFVQQFGISSSFFSLIQHLADRRLWWSSNGRHGHGSFSPASTQTPLATTLEAGKVIR